MTVWKMSFKILEEFQNTNNNSHLLARGRNLRFRRLVFKSGWRPVQSSPIPRFSTRQIEGGGENGCITTRVLHTMIFVLKSHLPTFSTAFFKTSKTCRTRVEPRSVGPVLHSLENLRRKRAQLERIAGDFTVDTHSLSDTRRGDAKAQVACLRQLALTYCSPDNNGLLVREFSEWWT